MSLLFTPKRRLFWNFKIKHSWLIMQVDKTHKVSEWSMYTKGLDEVIVLPCGLLEKF